MQPSAGGLEMKSACLLFFLASLPPPLLTDDSGEDFFFMFSSSFFSRRLNANSFFKVASLHPGGRFSSWQEAASPGPAFGRRRFLQPLIPPVSFFFSFFAAEFGAFFFFLDELARFQEPSRGDSPHLWRQRGHSKLLKDNHDLNHLRQSGKVFRLDSTGYEWLWSRVDEEEIMKEVEEEKGKEE